MAVPDDRRIETLPMKAVQPVIEVIRPAVHFVGFWLAVALPLLYLPLLVDGLEGGDLSLFLGLFVVNILALLAGHNYAR